MCKTLSYTLNGITAMCGLISAYYLMLLSGAAPFFYKKSFSWYFKSLDFLSIQSRLWQVMQKLILCYTLKLLWTKNSAYYLMPHPRTLGTQFISKWMNSSVYTFKFWSLPLFLLDNRQNVGKLHVHVKLQIFSSHKVWLSILWSIYLHQFQMQLDLLNYIAPIFCIQFWKITRMSSKIYQELSWDVEFWYIWHATLHLQLFGRWIADTQHQRQLFGC